MRATDPPPIDPLASARRRFRAWGRGPRNARRLDLLRRKHGSGPGLTESEAAELEILKAEGAALAGVLWRDRLEYLEELREATHAEQ